MRPTQSPAPVPLPTQFRLKAPLAPGARPLSTLNTELMFSSESPDWETPDEFFNALDAEFNFILDVCANKVNSKCVEYYDRQANTFTQPWYRHNGWLWMNPPYGNPEFPCKKKCEKKRCIARGYHAREYIPGIIDFVHKAWIEVMRGAKVVALVPARTDTAWFGYFWNYRTHRPRKWVKSLRFIRGRLPFIKEGDDPRRSDPAPFPSLIAVLSIEGAYRHTIPPRDVNS